uniref:tetratricopeptide repeat protein n=1 Tax=Agathobacter sp. TaxID=2021311 RepID=UPI0040568950
MKIKFDNRIVLTKKGEFVDREKEREFFWGKYDELCQIGDEWSVTVINYWGMGGIGKSQILKKLLTEAEEKTAEWNEEIPTVYISLSEEDSPIKIINKMVHILKQMGFSFPMYEAALFELGRAGGNPVIREDIKSIEESSVLISTLTEWSAVEPNIAIAGAVFKALDKSLKAVRTYLENKKHNLEEIGKMLPEELEKAIPGYFAEDLYWNIANSTFTYPVIVFLDKFESLRKRITGVDEVDMQIDWLKDVLILQVPKVVWVCSSREKLEWDKNEEWDDSVYNIKVNPFDEKWMTEFFKVNKMEVEELKQELFDLTKGVPLFLDICYELYQKLQKRNEMIDFSKFQGKQKKLLQTYIENLSEGEMYVLFVLSCIGEWDKSFIQFAAQKSRRSDFVEAYNILLRKSYIEEVNGKIELHQVIKEQVFAFCNDEISQEVGQMIYEFMPKEEFSWFYPKYLRCKLKCIHSDAEFDAWWVQPDLQLLKDLAIGSNMNGFEACYRVVTEFTKTQFEDSVMHLVLSVFHIRNLLKLKCFKQAQSEANHVIRTCKVSQKYVNEEFRNFASEFFELKAQALDGQKKFLLALNIRKALCEENTCYGESTKISRLHNLATSYQNMEQYTEALEILKEVTAYREKHILENPDDYIRALALQVNIFSQYYESDVEQPDTMALAIAYGRKAYDEAHRVLAESSVLRMEVDLIYARLLMRLRLWSEAHPVLTGVYHRLLEMNQGRNAYIDEVEFMLAAATMEIGKFQKAFELLEGLESSAKEYTEGSDLFVLRCQLEKGISLSKSKNHQGAKACFLNGLQKGKHLYGYNEKIVLKLAYAAAVEDYFLGDCEKCMEQLNEILPHVTTVFSDNSEFVYMIKAQIIRCKEAKKHF